MKVKTLKILSYLYLILPVIIFIIGWCKPIYSLPITIVLLIILKLLYNQSKEENEIFVNENYLMLLFILISIICITAGQGGFFYQSRDWDARNAIFRDLINFDWPVYYEKSNSALTYYIGQWMVPSVVGKIFSLISEEEAWIKGNVALLIWNAIGVTLSILWIVKKTNTTKKSHIFTIFFVFLFFSGLDIIGAIISKNFRFLDTLHLEWWGITYQYSSMISQLFWVFNQCIAPWLITLMFLEEKRVNNYLLLIILCLPYAPLPFLGLVILFGCKGIYFLIQSIKNKGIKEFLLDVFSIQNIAMLIFVFPIYLSLYIGNAATVGDESRRWFFFNYRLFSTNTNTKNIIVLFFRGWYIWYNFIEGT